MTFSRLTTGIPGLDEMADGGLPVPSTTLIAGEPGTGKTTFTVQSLFHGAKNGDVGLYVTGISEPQWVVQKFLSTFEFYDQELVENEQVVFLDVSSEMRDDPAGVLEHLNDMVEAYNPQRIVVDPITPFVDMLPDEIPARKFMHDLFARFKVWNAVSLVTAEMSSTEVSFSLEGYMVDSVIVLSYPEIDSVRRKYIEVLKMRGTRHLTGKQLLDISSKGMKVQVGLR